MQNVLVHPVNNLLSHLVDGAGCKTVEGLQTIQLTSCSYHGNTQTVNLHNKTHKAKIFLNLFLLHFCPWTFSVVQM